MDGLGQDADRDRVCSRAAARGLAGERLARAHTALLSTFAARGAPTEQDVGELIGSAGGLLFAADRLWAAYATRGGPDRPARLLELLARELDACERDVLSGQATYALAVEDAERPAAGMREALSALARRARDMDDLVRAQGSAVQLAALLLRAAGNVMTAARADGAPEPLSPWIERRVAVVVDGVAWRARALRRGVTDTSDVVAHLLTVAVRHASGLDAEKEGECGAWLEAAALEYAALIALEETLYVPTSNQYATRTAVSTERTCTELCGARLASRSAEFRWSDASRAHGIGLTHALKTYAGAPPDGLLALMHTHTILETLLARSLAVLVLFELQRAPSTQRSRSAGG